MFIIGIFFMVFMELEQEHKCILNGNLSVYHLLAAEMR